MEEEAAAESETSATERKTKSNDNYGEDDSQIKVKVENSHDVDNRNNLKSKTQLDNDHEEGIELEDFEVNASPFVTKQEAMKMYCLPMGTLEVCEFVEKPNPRNQKFSSMKLYRRSEIRRRARERYGGLERLIQERKRREKKRLEKDLEDVHGVFQTGMKRSRKL